VPRSGDIEADEWPPRYCGLYSKDPIDTLRSFLVEDLYNFFYWMLSDRRGRIRKARTVQTYWNTLTLVRQLETGCYDVQPAVQIEMCGVCTSPSHQMSVD